VGLAVKRNSINMGVPIIRFGSGTLQIVSAFVRLSSLVYMNLQSQTILVKAVSFSCSIRRTCLCTSSRYGRDPQTSHLVVAAIASTSVGALVRYVQFQQLSKPKKR
jgi:hypothetical protein